MDTKNIHHEPNSTFSFLAFIAFLVVAQEHPGKYGKNTVGSGWQPFYFYSVNNFLLLN